MTEGAIGRIDKLRAEARRRMAASREGTKVVKPKRAPRYDDVFWEGQTIFKDNDGCASPSSPLEHQEPNASDAQMWLDFDVVWGVR